MIVAEPGALKVTFHEVPDPLTDATDELLELALGGAHGPVVPSLQSHCTNSVAELPTLPLTFPGEANMSTSRLIKFMLCAILFALKVDTDARRRATASTLGVARRSIDAK